MGQSIKIKLKNGKEETIWEGTDDRDRTCKWCSKEIAKGKTTYQPDFKAYYSCCSLAHAKAFLNSQV